MFPVYRYEQELLSSIQRTNELAPGAPENRGLACRTCLDGQIGGDKVNIISILKDL